MVDIRPMSYEGGHNVVVARPCGAPGKHLFKVTYYAIMVWKRELTDSLTTMLTDFGIHYWDLF